MKKNFPFIFLLLILAACTSSPKEETKTQPVKKDSATTPAKETTEEKKPGQASCKNDTLNTVAAIIAGIPDSSAIYATVKSSPAFKSFSRSMEKRWHTFDSTRLATLRNFREKELSKEVKNPSTLFYPFSGPDILYAATFFPDADNYVMVGLEPVGTLPDWENDKTDTLELYFNKVNTSLNAILKFSFFRTKSMKSDFADAEVNGTLHLLMLFLKRTGHELCSAKPITLDSTGKLIYVDRFETLRRMNVKTRGVEITFTGNGKKKTLRYFSTNAADEALKHNKGFVSFLKSMGTVTTYLKGASYLMHKNYFSIIRNVILEQSSQVVQDDSGIALNYFLKSNSKWSFKFYGQYTHPIPMFSQFYQPVLDSLYKKEGSTPIGFGIGYNFKDRNSNFMIATKQ